MDLLKVIKQFRRKIIKQLHRNGREIGLLQPHRTPQIEELFNRANARISSERGYLLLEFLKATTTISGDIVEMGVYKGASAYIIADLVKRKGLSKQIFLCDTFSGTPDNQSGKDNVQHKGEYYDTDIASVREFLSEFNEQIVFIPGFIPVSMARYGDIIISFVHIHLNLYQSTKDALTFLYPRLSDGGIAIIEDYGLISCGGVKKAADEFCALMGCAFIHLTSGQGVILKRQLLPPPP